MVGIGAGVAARVVGRGEAGDGVATLTDAGADVVGVSVSALGNGVSIGTATQVGRGIWAGVGWPNGTGVRVDDAAPEAGVETHERSLTGRARPGVTQAARAKHPVRDSAPNQSRAFTAHPPARNKEAALRGPSVAEAAIALCSAKTLSGSRPCGHAARGRRLVGGRTDLNERTGGRCQGVVNALMRV